MPTDLPDEDAILQVQDPALADGFKPWDEDEYDWMFVIYPIGTLTNHKALDKRHAVEDRLNEVLAWTGCGECDGGSNGRESMEVACQVVDFELAKKVVIQALTGTQFGDFSAIRIYQLRYERLARNAQRYLEGCQAVVKSKAVLGLLGATTLAGSCWSTAVAAPPKSTTAAPPESTAAATPKSPVTTTVCELVKHQQAHDGTLVSIEARATTDAIEHTFAGDATPAGAGDCGMLVHYKSAPATEEYLKQFQRALTEAHHASTESRVLSVYARLVGTFHRDPSGTYMPSIEVSDIGPFKIAVGPPMIPPPPPLPPRH